MDIKRVAEIFYKVLRKLSPAARMMALSSMLSLYCAINPTVEPVGPIQWHHNYLVDDTNGEPGLYFVLWTMDPPESYVNSSETPKIGDEVLMIREKEHPDKTYFCKFWAKPMYEEMEDMVLKAKKSEKSKKMLYSFLFTMGLALGSYPGIIAKFAALVKGVK